MAKIKEVSSYNGTSWDTPVPIGANDANIDITSSTTNPTDTTSTSAGLVDSNVTVAAGDTAASAWTKFNRFRKRVQNAFGNFAGVTLRTAYNTSNTSTSVYTTGVINNYMSNVIGYTGTTEPSAGTVAAQLSSLNSKDASHDTSISNLQTGLDNVFVCKTISNADDAPIGVSAISDVGTNNPFSFWCTIITTYGQAAYKQQIAIPWAQGEQSIIARRSMDNGTWNAWNIDYSTPAYYSLTQNNTKINVIGGSTTVQFNRMLFIRILFEVKSSVAKDESLFTLPVACRINAGTITLIKQSGAGYATVAIRNNTDLFVNYGNGIPSTGWWILDGILYTF